MFFAGLELPWVEGEIVSAKRVVVLTVKKSIDCEGESSDT